MSQVNVYEAKTHLSRLLDRAEAGEEIVIARAGRPVARLCPILPVEQHGRTLGRDSGLLRVPDDFDDPLPPEVLEGFLT